MCSSKVLDVSAINIFYICTEWFLKQIYLRLLAINTVRARLIQAVRKKQLIRTWLCAGISLFLYALQTW